MRRLFVPGALLLVLGGTILGSGPDWQRVPGPFLAGAEQRSVDSTTVAVAEWAGTYLPDGSNVAADATFSRVIPNFADITSVTQPAGFESVTPMFISECFDQTSLQLILRNEVDFVVVDTRLVGQSVRSGAFYEGGAGYGEAAADGHAGDGVASSRRSPASTWSSTARSGSTTSARCAASRRRSRTASAPGLPGTWTPWQVGVTAGPAPGRHRRCAAACSTYAASAPRTPGGSRSSPRRDGHRRRRCRPRLRTRSPGPSAPPSCSSSWCGSAPTPIRCRADSSRGSRGSGAALITVLAAVSVALAIWSTWHGLLDFAPLPTPLVGAAS